MSGNAPMQSPRLKQGISFAQAITLKMAMGQDCLDFSNLKISSLEGLEDAHLLYLARSMR